MAAELFFFDLFSWSSLFCQESKYRSYYRGFKQEDTKPHPALRYFVDRLAVAERIQLVCGITSPFRHEGAPITSPEQYFTPENTLAVGP